MFTYLQIIPSGRRGRLATYMKVLMSQWGLDTKHPPGDLGLVCSPVWDLEQNVLGTTVDFSGKLPTMLTHGELWSLEHQRSMLPLEHFLAQGIPVSVA